jgi:hypothetical protein
LVLAFLAVWVLGYAVYWANLLTLGLIEMADAFGAFIGVDFVDELALIDGIVGAFWLADVAINAFIRNH